MTKSNRSDAVHSAKDSFTEIHRIWATRLSNVYHWGSTNEADATEVRLRCRGESDWLAVAKRVGDDGGPEVVFANGFDFVSCWLALNASMAADQWKVDKPWKP